MTIMGRNEEGNVRTMVRWCDDGRDRRKKGWKKEVREETLKRIADRPLRTLFTKEVFEMRLADKR